jgi:hypothetical protein
MNWERTMREQHSIRARIDPWNAAARDEKARNYQDTFNLIRQVVPAGDDGPAIGIVAHTRKPQSDERVNGRTLLNLLAGSYVLGSVPRTVFVMQAASDDVTDDRIVWTCCKNNDGELGKRSAWIRRNGLFDAVTDFDWEAWNKDGKSIIVGVEIVPQIVAQNGGSLARDILRVKIEEKGTSKRTAYRRIDEAEQPRGDCQSLLYGATVAQHLPLRKGFLAIGANLLSSCRSGAAAAVPGSSQQRGTRVSGEEAFDSLGPFLGCLLRINSPQLASLDSIRDRLIDLRWNPRLTSTGQDYQVLK